MQNILGSMDTKRNPSVDVEQLKAFLGGSLGATSSYKTLQNYGQFNDPMSAFGGTAGQIAQGAKQQETAGLQGLARSGLGRSSARASVASGAAANASNQTSDLFSGLRQQSMQQRQSMANTAFDTDRMVTSLALGMNPDPRAAGAFRQGERTSKTGQIIQMAGGVGGSIMSGLGAMGI